ncbi:hypothetical protein GHK49_14005, partial [Sinorhizobium fredii]|nr:hypothetical protein [Sinorhizobium fredii]
MLRTSACRKRSACRFRKTLCESANETNVANQLRKFLHRFVFLQQVPQQPKQIARP